jgi:hypothetical protein
MAKRKEDPQQPELPKRATEPVAAPSVNGAPDKNGNGETHIKAEDVPAEVVHRPFVPGDRDLELHKRVDTNFLQYASYVAGAAAHSLGAEADG